MNPLNQLRSRFVIGVLLHQLAAHGQVEDEAAQAREGVGGFAEARAAAALDGMEVQIGKILHPSPASPAANRGWAEAATKQMSAQGIWS